MLFSDANVMNEGKHYPGERIWVDLQPWLKSCGYTLRDRYQPGWVASWLKPGAKKRWRDCEDGLVPDVCNKLSKLTTCELNIFSCSLPISWMHHEKTARS